MFLNKFKPLLPVIYQCSPCLLHDPILKTSVLQPAAWLHTSAALERARTSTRLRKMKVAQANRRKKLAKMPEKPQGFIPYHERQRLKGGAVSPRMDYFSQKPDIPKDDVYVTKYYRWPMYTVESALQQLQQTYHPEIYNLPDNLVYLYMELSLATEKKTRFLSEVSNIVTVPHPFESGQRRSVAVLTDDPAQQAAATEAGATLVMGSEVLGLLRSKEVSVADYDYVVCDLPFLAAISSKGIRALFKKKFPNTKNGTAVPDTRTVVTTFLTGIKYDAEKDLFDKEFGKMLVPVGRVDMAGGAVRDNIRAVLDSVESQRARKSGVFISNVRLQSPPQKEMLYLDVASLELRYLRPPKPMLGTVEELEAEEAAA